MVFQSYALYPRMTVRGNIAFGLRMRRTPKVERPAALSGGQRQRVAMGRAIVREPKIFLMDEPLSNLDAKLRVSMRAQPMLHQRLGVTTVYVTHDQVEAMTLGLRPTAFSLAAGNGWPTISAVPSVVEDLGDERYVVFDIDAPRVDTDATRAAIDATTADDALLIPEDKARSTARLPADAPVTVGQPLSLAINPDRLHFFDPESGATL
jgi:ABC-type sugar transport system ATPase subunit